jgi:hypothetical protein
MSKSPIHAVVERFDGDIAVIETREGTAYRLDRAELPEGCRVGHHLQMEIENGQINQVTIDDEATAQARERIEDLMNKLRRGDHLKDGED